jgi:hypothetical protein
LRRRCFVKDWSLFNYDYDSEAEWEDEEEGEDLLQSDDGSDNAPDELQYDDFFRRDEDLGSDAVCAYVRDTCSSHMQLMLMAGE